MKLCVASCYSGETHQCDPCRDSSAGGAAAVCAGSCSDTRAKLASLGLTSGMRRNFPVITWLCVTAPLQKGVDKMMPPPDVFLSTFQMLNFKIKDGQLLASRYFSQCNRSVTEIFYSDYWG